MVNYLIDYVSRETFCFNSNQDNANILKNYKLLRANKKIQLEIVLQVYIKYHLFYKINKTANVIRNQTNIVSRETIKKRN